MSTSCKKIQIGVSGIYKKNCNDYKNFSACKLFFCSLETFWLIVPLFHKARLFWKKLLENKSTYFRPVARSENPGGLVVLWWAYSAPLVEIGLTEMSKTGGAEAPPAPTGDSPVFNFNIANVEKFMRMIFISFLFWDDLELKHSQKPVLL